MCDCACACVCVRVRVCACVLGGVCMRGKGPAFFLTKFEEGEEEEEEGNMISDILACKCQRGFILFATTTPRVVRN